ncbi:50S ribosomal protein L5 [Patescibacteria group bacterium]
MNRMKEQYIKKVRPAVLKQFGMKNIMQVSQIKKVVLNAGIGSFMDNKDAVEGFVQELSDLSGQKAYPRKARLSEAGFKIKKGDIVGYAVTLRGERMWAFLDKLINIAFPRIRDFRGFSVDSFDSSGNYSVGIREHTIFPEVNPNTTKGIRSMQVSIVFNSDEKEMNKFVLSELGFPFRE